MSFLGCDTMSVSYCFLTFWWHSVPATCEETLIQQYTVTSQKMCISFFLCIVLPSSCALCSYKCFVLLWATQMYCLCLSLIPTNKMLLWQDFDATFLINGCRLFLSQSLPQKIMIYDFGAILQWAYRRTSLVNHCLPVVKIFVPFIYVLCTLFSLSLN